MTVKPKLDDLIQSVTLYSNVNTLLHGYVLPFVIIYSGWIYVWGFIYGFSDFYEGGFVGLSTIACLQILCCLCCHWSVHIRCFFTCKWVSTALISITSKSNAFYRKRI